MTKAETEEKCTNKFCQSFQKQRQKGKGEEKQEVGDNLSACVLNLLP